MCITADIEQLRHYLAHLYQRVQTRDPNNDADQLCRIAQRIPSPTKVDDYPILCFWCTYYPGLCGTQPEYCLCQQWWKPYFDKPGKWYPRCNKANNFQKHCIKHCGGKYCRQNH